MSQRRKARRNERRNLATRAVTGGLSTVNDGSVAPGDLKQPAPDTESNGAISRGTKPKLRAHEKLLLANWVIAHWGEMVIGERVTRKEFGARALADCKREAEIHDHRNNDGSLCFSGVESCGWSMLQTVLLLAGKTWPYSAIDRNIEGRTSDALLDLAPVVVLVHHMAVGLGIDVGNLGIADDLAKTVAKARAVMKGRRS